MTGKRINPDRILTPTEKGQRYRKKYPNRRTDYMREYRKRNPEQIKVNNKNQYYKNCIKTLFRNAKSRAKIQGHEFNITIDDLDLPEKCPILEIPLDGYISKNRNNNPSIDRIDNTKGYIKGNVCIISFKANRMKSDLTIEELEKILDYIKRNIGINEENT